MEDFKKAYTQLIFCNKKLLPKWKKLTSDVNGSNVKKMFIIPSY